MQTLKRKLAAALLLAPLGAMLVACAASAMGRPPQAGQPQLSPAQQRLNGLGVTLVVDAVEGAEMLGNEFFADGRDSPFYASSVTRKGNRSIMAFPSGVVPERVRVIWRDTSTLVRRADNPSKTTYAGNVLGDHTVLVASRIPDEVVKELRRGGGSLRLKFRLKPDGVLFGWDIERFGGGLPQHSMPGGDFLETWY